MNFMTFHGQLGISSYHPFFDEVIERGRVQPPTSVGSIAMIKFPISPVKHHGDLMAKSLNSWSTGPYKLPTCFHGIRRPVSRWFSGNIIKRNVFFPASQAMFWLVIRNVFYLSMFGEWYSQLTNIFQKRLKPPIVGIPEHIYIKCTFAAKCHN